MTQLSCFLVPLPPGPPDLGRFSAFAPPRPTPQLTPPPRRPALRPALFRPLGALFTRGACWGGLLGQRWPASCPLAMPRGRGGGGGGLRQGPATSAPLASPSYYERVGQLQQALRDRYGRGTGQGVSGATESIGLPCPAHFPPVVHQSWNSPATPQLAPDGVGSTSLPQMHLV